MPNGEQDRETLTARRNWSRYAAGVLTEAAFILALTGIALLMAVLATAVVR